MKRHIIQHGSSTLSVSLPYRWVKRLNLKKGDELDIEEQPSVLVIHGKTPAAAKPKRLVVKKDVFLRRMLLNAYREGYDTIVIESEDILDFEKISSVVTQMIGFEMMEQTSHKCLLTCVANAIGENFESLFRRAYRITLELAQHIESWCICSHTANAQESISLEHTNNRLTNVCIRLLNKEGHGDLGTSLRLHSILIHLEEIADSYSNLAKDISIQSGKRTDELQQLRKSLSALSHVFHIIYECSYKPSLETQTVIKKHISLLREQTRVTISKTKNPLWYGHVLSLVEELHHLSMYTVVDLKEKGN